ncbi:hypothetical protein CDAR_484011 [Caerostris darwini]|uniref:Maturase K n=1 Tax=Caerostris darwini TaxID=1538125 RepID=A0AAV4T8K1_9ARAC|nr:hypothetical protein CDAR_484011 [Caerostris darwini]
MSVRFCDSLAEPVLCWSHYDGLEEHTAGWQSWIYKFRTACGLELQHYCSIECLHFPAFLLEPNRGHASLLPSSWSPTKDMSLCGFVVPIHKIDKSLVSSFSRVLYVQNPTRYPPGVSSF